MKILVTIECEKCGKVLGTIELGPKQLGELKTATKIGLFTGPLIALFAKNGIEHDRECRVPRKNT